MKPALQTILYHLARLILWRQQPQVIAITGSVGKSSTKEAVYAVLASHYRVRRNQENYNNEFGVPLTIIGSRSGGRNPVRWLVILIKGLLYGVLPLSYPQLLVLEMGVDRPGDMKYLTALAPAHIGIVTLISDEPAHLEWFKDIEQLAQEKLIMYRHLKKKAWAILNLDEPYSRDYREKSKASTLTIAVDHEADLRALEIDYSTDPKALLQAQSTAGIRFKVQYQGNIIPCFLPRVIGVPSVYAALFALAVGRIYNLNFVDMTAALQQFHPPRGRLNLLAGKQDSVIIDDTYNSSPAAVRAALQVIHNIKTPGHRIVCLGNMEELGKYSKRSHTTIGKYLATLEIDYVITVGDKAADIATAALAAGFPAAAVWSVATSQAAAQQLHSLVQAHDIILVKGSQAMRLERIVNVLLAEPQRATELLVRQYGHWQKL